MGLSLTTISTNHYLILAAILFTLGFVGLLMRRNLLIVFMCIEVLLNSANLAFVAISRHYGLMEGHVLVFFVMAVAAAEAAVGLAIVVTLFRNRRTVESTDWRLMGG